jgi:hypothetical protein
MGNPFNFYIDRLNRDIIGRGDVMKSFLSDSDGLSLYEFLALLIIGAFLVITLIVFVMILKGYDVSQMLDFYKSFITIPATVVGGVFLQGSAREVWGKRQSNKLANETYGKSNTYEYYGDDYSDSEYRV